MDILCRDPMTDSGIIAINAASARYVADHCYKDDERRTRFTNGMLVSDTSGKEWLLRDMEKDVCVHALIKLFTEKSVDLATGPLQFWAYEAA